MTKKAEEDQLRKDLKAAEDWLREKLKSDPKEAESCVRDVRAQIETYLQRGDFQTAKLAIELALSFKRDEENRS